MIINNSNEGRVNTGLTNQLVTVELSFKINQIKF